MRLSIIVAMGVNRVIGSKGKLPWHLPEDLKTFKALTFGHPIIMGRTTQVECIADRFPLTNRTNIVISSVDIVSKVPEIKYVKTPDEALQVAKASPGSDEIFVIGGAKVYEAFLPLVDRVYLTKINRHFDGDVTFPPLAAKEWGLTSGAFKVCVLNGREEVTVDFMVFDRIEQRG